MISKSTSAVAINVSAVGQTTSYFAVVGLEYSTTSESMTVSYVCQWRAVSFAGTNVRSKNRMSSAMD
jgi:hypothetical protein